MSTYNSEMRTIIGSDQANSVKNTEFNKHMSIFVFIEMI
jgi:hypothetical protein